MKTKLLLLLLVFVSSLSFGQIQDLATLSNGKMAYGSVLYDSDNNVYGYLYIYQLDINQTDKKMEYVFLDKNLNKVSNATYSEKKYSNDSKLNIGVKSNYYDCTLMGDYIILNKNYYYYKAVTFGNNAPVTQPLLTTFQLISLKDDTVSQEYTYENGQFSVMTTDFNKLKKEYKNNKTKNIIYGFNSNNIKGFFIFDDNIDKRYLSKELKFYNEKMEPLWTYVYNPVATKKDYVKFYFETTKNNTIYLSEVHFKKGLCVDYKIVALDFLTGKKKYEYVLETPKSKYSHTLITREVDGQLTISGRYCPYSQKDGYLLDNDLGFYKILLDENGKAIQEKYTQWSDFRPYIDVDKNGRVEKNFRLRPTKTFFFKDGSMSVLTEKYKPSGYNMFVGTTASKSDDYVLFLMDKDFNAKDVQIINKAKSNADIYNDYLFSQYIKDENGAVFFFQNYDKNDETKEKQWFLGINTIIDGKLTQEKIPISSKKKYAIAPAPAKEGYIMLREYNEKDKYNQIRLEKLNY